MEMLNFSKYQGTGNDFVMIDDRRSEFITSKEVVSWLCNRHYGIGADGLILLQNDPSFCTDFRMKYFNSDGLEGSMCGNGGRCIVKFAADLGIISSKTEFIAIDGKHIAKIEQEEVGLKMQDVKSIDHFDGYLHCNTGSPHVVFFVDGPLDEYPVVKQGKAIRYSNFWTDRGGTNVNFVERVGYNVFNLRTYERGVEDETLSCGTGAVATALVGAHLNKITSPIQLIAKGGGLTVHFKKKSNNSFENIYLTGKVKHVFSGYIKI